MPGPRCICRRWDGAASIRRSAELTSAGHIVTGVSTHPRGVMPVSGSFTGGSADYLALHVTVKTTPLTVLAPPTVDFSRFSCHRQGCDSKAGSLARCSRLAMTSAPRMQAPAAQAPAAPDPVRTLVSRLDLQRYKATIKGLTQFGDRRQGTERNRRAIDWIEALLKSYGCPTGRLKYEFKTPPPNPGRGRGAPDPNARAVGGGRPRGQRVRTGVNTDPMRQPDARLRALNSEPAKDGPARRGLLHEGRHLSSRRDVHHRRAHGRARLGRGRERRRLGHGAGDGAGAGVLDARRPDRALDPVRALEQRRDRLERRSRLRRAAEGPAGEGRSPRLGPVSGTAAGSG